MKNKFLSIVLCAMLFSTTACDEEFLDIAPEDQPTVDNFYNNATEIRAVTATLYGRPWFEYNDKFSWAAGDGMAGDLYNDYSTEGELFFLTYTEQNNIFSQGWRGLYEVISYANAVINDMPGPAAGNGVPEQDINAALGEARFVRAFAYYILAEYWEEVPIIENAGELIANGNIEIEKHTYASIYQFIIRDLEFAAQHLPESDQPGRLTSWAAKGMLAKAHLTRAQKDQSQEGFDKAAAYAADVIQNSGFGLMSNYADLFTIPNNNNQESLFALQMLPGAWGFGNSRQAVMGRSSIITGNSEAWGGGKGVTIDFMQNVIENAEGEEDLRRPAIYMTLGDRYPEISLEVYGLNEQGVEVLVATEPYEYLFSRNDYKGTNVEYANAVLNSIKKYVVGSTQDLGVPINNQGVPLNLNMLRLADVYLIYAEAVLGMGESTSDGTALTYFNAVRERAGLDPRQTITFQNILDERRVEFGMEGQNWLDVKRFYYRNPSGAVAYLNAQDRARTYEPIDDAQDVNTWEAYVIEPPASPVVITEEDMVIPIPAGEVAQNPNLLKPAVEYTFE